MEELSGNQVLFFLKNMDAQKTAFIHVVMRILTHTGVMIIWVTSTIMLPLNRQERKLT